MKKYLFSIILTCVFLISPVTYAADIGAPSYQVDVIHSVADTVSNGVVASATRHESQSKNTNLNITSLNELSKPHSSTLIVACSYDSVENANVLRVFGGNPIGIGRPI